METYTVSQLASYLGVSGNTVRNWGDEFADFLSPGAQPPKGAPREYTEEDAAILETVAVLRDQHVAYEDIRERLAEGERLEFQERPGEAQKKVKDAAGGEGSETALVTESFARALQAYEGQVARLQDKIDELHSELRKVERRATAAETELRVLRDQQEAQKPTEGETVATEGQGETDEGRPWWRFWGT